MRFKVKNFIDRLCALDTQHSLSDLVWKEFTSSIRILLNNKFVFQPFWQYQNNKHLATDNVPADEHWQAAFKKANAAANKALGQKNTEKVLSVIFHACIHYVIKPCMVVQHGIALLTETKCEMLLLL